MEATLFSPLKQSTIWEVQTTIRQIDMSLFNSVKQKIGIDQTFVYSTLGGCCAFLDSNLNEFSTEIQKFAHDVVTPVVKECFEEIEKFNGEITNSQLKLSLSKKLDRVKFYPERFGFESIKNEEAITELQKIIDVGNLTLYKVNPNSEKFYGGRIDISEEAFSKAAQVLEKHGYKQDKDVIGSSFDKLGHITTIEPRELTKNYDTVISHHENFIKESNEVSINPKGIEIGNPQGGRLSRAVTITMEVEGLDTYRGTLGPLKIPAHLSVFSQEIQTIPTLSKISIKEFTNSPKNPNLMKLHTFLLKYF